MSNRITEANLQAVVDRINRTVNAPMEPWTRLPNGTARANVGNYHLSHAYGRVSLEVMINEGGGVKRVCGSGTKRELYNEMFAFIAGLEVPNV